MDDPSLSSAEAPLPASLRPMRPLHNLPAATSRLVGREAERTALIALLRDPASRLVTLSGVGGVGKTRLALQVAADLLAAGGAPYPDGIFLVTLEAPFPPEAPGEALAAAIASALGLTLSGPEATSAQVVSYLRDRRALLVIDGEQLRAGANLLARLLAGAPTVTVLASTRERVGIAGELVRPLDGLTCPPEQGAGPLADYGAAALFVELARRLNPALGLTPEVERAIGRICRLVDGLPLGIELAAGWAGVLSCDEIAAELAQSLDLLTSDRPDLPERHRSVRAAFNASWERLSLPESMALRRLGVFSGAFGRESAEAVLGSLSGDERPAPSAVLAVLALLVDKSLVRREDGAGATRYRLPRAVRQYAAEQLAEAGEAVAVARLHMAHTLDALAARTSELRGDGQQRALAAIEAQIADVRAAWRAAAEAGSADLIGRAAPALFHFYDMRSWFSEGAEAFATARRGLEARAANGAALGIVVAREGWFSFYLGRLGEAIAGLNRGLALLRAAGATAEQVFPLNYLAAATNYAGDSDGALHFGEEALALARDLGDRYGQAVACNILGQICYDRGEFAAAQAWSAQSLALEQQIGNRFSMAYSLTNLGKAAHASRDYSEARRLFRESLEIRRELGDTRGVAICLTRLGEAAAAVGEPMAAVDHFEQSFRLFEVIGNRWGVASSLFHLGLLARDQGASGAATRVLQEALSHALGAQTRPQIVATMAALGQLATTEDGWQRDLGRLAAARDLDLTSEEVARQLAWATSPSTISMTVAEALAQLREHIARPPAEPRPQGEAAVAIGRDGITTRELEVLRLVAEGLTDAQVAERLILSRRTVSTHLSSIYSKLQVSSRTAAVHAARDQGLLT